MFTMSISRRVLTYGVGLATAAIAGSLMTALASPAPLAVAKLRTRLLWCWLVGLVVATGLAVGAAPAGAVTAGTDRQESTGTGKAAAVLVPVCVNFLPLADNTVLGNNFVRGGHQFQSLGGGLVPFVNVFSDLNGDDVHGVQFDNAGIRVAQPSPADVVDVTIGVFDLPGVQIRAFDATGAVVDSAFVPADNIIHPVTLDGATDITRLRFTGGGNEAVINEICSS